MKTHNHILSSACLLIAIGLAPSSFLSTPASAKPTSGKSASAATESVAKMNADIDKLIAQKKKKFEQLYPASQVDIDSGKYADAEKKLLEAVKVTEGIGENEPKLLALTRLGDCYFKWKKYKEAEKYYRESYDTNVELYRGNYPVLMDAAKGLSQVYNTTGKTKEAAKILSDAKSTRATRYSVAAVDEADLFATYYESLRSALGKADSASVGKMFQYPVSIKWNGDNSKRSGTRSFRSEKELAANYNAIFTPKILELFRDTPEKDLWCRDQGIMLGSGHLWLVNVNLVKVAGKSDYKIQGMTINASLPKSVSSTRK